MNLAFWTDESIAGSLLVASLLILFIALFIMIGRGATPGYSAMLQGNLTEIEPYINTFRLTILLFALAWIVQLLGLGLFTRLLVRVGGEQLAILSLTLVLVATGLLILDATFHMSIELWAAQEAARTGSVPEVFEPLQTWAHNFATVGYMAHLVATAGFGWAILNSDLLAPWVGWIASGWSVLWLLGGLVGIGIPAIPLLMPVLIGFVLLLG